MKRESMRWAAALAVFVQGCTLEAAPQSSGPDVDQPTSWGHVLSQTCERVDELGLAAQGVRLKANHVDAVDAPCVSLANGRIAAFGARECQLVAPTGFALDGCFDSYDCGGCPVVVRSDPSYGFVISGESERPECADVAAKYALVPAPVCASHPTHD